MKGDRVEIVIDAGGASRTYEVTATKAGRRVEVVTGRGVVEVMEVTRGGSVVRTARFMASRVLALVEHPASDGGTDGGRRPAASAGRPTDEAGEPVSMVDDAVDRTISQLG
jgi:hypothetical protein